MIRIISGNHMCNVIVMTTKLHACLCSVTDRMTKSLIFSHWVISSDCFHHCFSFYFLELRFDICVLQFVNVTNAG